jgi:hypothetical protein
MHDNNIEHFMSPASLPSAPLRAGGTRRCPHSETIETSNYGLLRRTCLTCGAVTVAYEKPADSGMLFRFPSLADR